MTEPSRHDAWQAGDRYEAYMGRWSRLVAPRFLDWLGAPGDMDWIDVGCGTGALSATILARCSPRSLLAIDPSEGFVAAARATLADPCAEARVGDAQALPLGNACKDVVVAGLVLNFVPDMHKALTEMRRVARPGGRVAFYVWDYPGGGLAFVHAFWLAAASLDAAAADLSEDRRFSSCTPDNLVALARGAGLGEVECAAIDVPTVFRDFEDYWHPFTLGAGPAPGYCTSLAPEERERLRERLRSNLPSTEDGAIRLDARAWAIRSIVT